MATEVVDVKPANPYRRVPNGRKGPASCHPEKNAFARGLCWVCYSKQLAEQGPMDSVDICSKCKVNPKAVTHTGHKHGWCRDCNRAAHNAYYQANKGRKLGPERGYRLKRKYGITLNQFDEMVNAQGNLCMICQVEMTHERGISTTKACVDHDHTTLQLRDILCNACNTGLGSFKDNVDRLQRAMEYLTRHQSLWQTAK